MRTLIHQTQEVPPATNPTPPAEGTRSHQSSLRSKLVLSLAAIFLVFLLLDEIVRRNVIEPEFMVLEQAGAIRDANRVLAAFHSEMAHLSELANHWAAHLDQHEAELAKYPDGTYHRTVDGLPWVAILHGDGTWTWIQGVDPVSSQANRLKAREFHRLVESRQDSSTSLTTGITRINDQTMAMFAAIALNEPNDLDLDPATSFVIVGRPIDQALLKKLEHQTQVTFSLQLLPQDTGRRTVRRQADHSNLMIELPLSGVGDEVLADLRIHVPRDITARSNRTTKLARNSFIFGSVAALLMLLVMLQRIVIGPLAAIREHSNRVAEQGFTTEPMLLTRNDEIGQLASAFDEMMRGLSDAQDPLARASQAAGRSQVASTVIHNVGNVLTNVNSLLDATSEGIEGLRIGPLHKLACRLRADRANDTLLAATPDYLEGLATSLKSDQEALRMLVSTLHENIVHIHDVIRDQQQHTHPSILSSRIQLEDVLNEAIACCRARLDEDMIDVNVSGSLSTSVYADRSLLLQTMINIIGNAHHAMRDNPDHDRVLTIEVLPADTMVRVTIRDNGCGMTPQVLARIFDAHFTTKETGTGLGLHFCALTIKRLGGSISSYSDGPGTGASFVIELPGRGNRPSMPNLAVYSASTNCCVPTT